MIAIVPLTFRYRDFCFSILIAIVGHCELSRLSFLIVALVSIVYLIAINQSVTLMQKTIQRPELPAAIADAGTCTSTGSRSCLFPIVSHLFRSSRCSLIGSKFCNDFNQLFAHHLNFFKRLSLIGCSEKSVKVARYLNEFDVFFSIFDIDFEREDVV